MQAAILPALAGSAATAGAAGTTIFSQLALGAQAASGLMGGIAAFQGAQAEKEAAEVNSYIGRTRAMQTDISHMRGLAGELAEMRSVFGANQQRPNVGTFEVYRELRDARARERRIDFGNRMQESADFRTAARNAGAQARMALPMGLMRAAPSLFSLYDLRAG